MHSVNSVDLHVTSKYIKISIVAQQSFAGNLCHRQQCKYVCLQAPDDALRQNNFCFVTDLFRRNI